MEQAHSHSLNVRFNGPQWEALSLIKPGHTLTNAWGRGVGKSWFDELIPLILIGQWEHRVRQTMYGATIRGIRVIWLMDTIKHWADIHKLPLLTLLEGRGADWGWLNAKIDKSSWTFTFPGGSWMRVMPAEAHRSKAGRGQRCDLIITDEADDVDLHVYESVAAPWLSEPWSLKMRLASGTPTRGRRGLLYHLYRLGLSDDPRHARYHSVHATYKDVPETVDAGAAQDAFDTRISDAVFRREWLCDFDSAEGLVYDVFDERYHVQEPPDGTTFTEVLVCVDHGYVDPGVFLLVGIQGHGEDAVAWVLDEIYETGKPNGWWDAKAKEWASPGQRWYADPSRPDRIADLRRCGARLVPAENSIDPGVSRVADMLFRRGDAQQARLFVHPKCVNTIREFTEYRRKKDPRDPDRHLEAIEDKNNHAMDALRYGLFTRFGKPPSYRKGRDLI